MTSLVKGSLSKEDKSSSSNLSYLRRPTIVSSQNRLSSSCYVESPTKQHGVCQSRSVQSKLPVIYLKRSNSSNTPRLSRSMSKTQLPFKRSTVPSPGPKATNSQISTRPNSVKNRNAVQIADSPRLEKSATKIAKTTIPALSKSFVSRSHSLTKSNNTSSRPKNVKSLENSSKPRTNGVVTGIRNKSVLAPTNCQSAKSLKDRLTETRDTPLRPPSRLATPSAPFRRVGVSGSLIPNVKRVSPSSCEEEFLMLKQNFELSLGSWNRIFDALCIFVQWSLTTRDRLREETSHRENMLNDQLRSYLEECAEVKAKHSELLKRHAESQREQAEKWEKERRNMQTKMENLRVSLQREKEQEIEQVRLQRQSEIAELQKAYDTQFSEGRRMWAAQVAESHQNFSRQLDQQKTEHETIIAEIKRKNAVHVNELENSLKSTQAEFLAKLDRLQSECDELHKRLEEVQQSLPAGPPRLLPLSPQRETSEVSVQIPSSPETESIGPKQKALQCFNFDDIPISMTRSCYTPQSNVVHPAFLSPTPTCPTSTLEKNRPVSVLRPLEPTNDSVMQEEIESLKVVLELKSAEAADLRQKTMQLEEELTTVKELNKEIKELQNRNENLEALLELRAESQKQLQDHIQGMFHNLEKEIKEKKKLKMDCEALRFKLLDAHHKIEQLNVANASEDDSLDMADSFYMSRSAYSNPRVNSAVAAASDRSQRQIFEALESTADADDRLPAGSFISLDTRPSSGSVRLRRGIQHDRSKRRTLATSAELERIVRD